MISTRWNARPQSSSPNRVGFEFRRIVVQPIGLVTLRPKNGIWVTLEARTPGAAIRRASAGRRSYRPRGPSETRWQRFGLAGKLESRTAALLRSGHDLT